MAAFSIALSGLTAASSDLDVTANNVANADTVGFKETRAQFADAWSRYVVGVAAHESVTSVTTLINHQSEN